jgi:hypothetical protein
MRRSVVLHPDRVVRSVDGRRAEEVNHADLVLDLGVLSSPARIGAGCAPVGATAGAGGVLVVS